MSYSAIKYRNPAGQQDGTGITADAYATNDTRASCDDGISNVEQITNATTASEDST
jgi:hypothetical protein